jgi:hypothetical protein
MAPKKKSCDNGTGEELNSKRKIKLQPTGKCYLNTTRFWAKY